MAEPRRAEVIRRVRDACMAGSQAYWVCPLIEDSDSERAAEPPSRRLARKAGRNDAQLTTALATHAAIEQTFPELKVGLIHGRLKTEEKARVMEAFASGAIQLLVATTVIEVGVDVPNATLMVIENAERMGLSQLHQLRGRVGRGAEAATCVLLYAHPLGDTARERLKIIYESRDGFEIARHDLRLRGPGRAARRAPERDPAPQFRGPRRRCRSSRRGARAPPKTLLSEDRGAAGRHLMRWLGGRHHLLTA